ncbi:hypothetical protein [Dyella mobilis]|uniref:Secreted protein n=1 Tax=Dyella mobilis TaxID=1849582 RepID=A0ABS2KMI3_9GAMM|nr:hypothetical protein [Dyella mobilis]MBM7132145.1 hypothetical protein [Dyella mobilis]GLQ95870.1 hypothetical protein GCM10007863_02880 [Dyella mobilis]
MSKFVTVVVLLVAAGFATAARAAPQNAPQDTPKDQSTAPQTSQPVHASPIKPGDRNCIRDTGSLIPPKKGECLPVMGRSYSQKDIQATGQTQLGPALQQLDPAITVSGHH